MTEPEGADQARKPLVVFIHIPKTGGTTIRNALRANYPAREFRSAGSLFSGTGGFKARRAERLPSTLESLSQNVQVLHGHMPFGVRRHLPEGARYITFLRDPVERTLSQYYSVRAGINEASLERDVALDEVIARDLIADNLQTRMLSDELDPTAAPSEEMLAQAKTNLRDGFAAFGVVERFDESFLLVMRRLGLEETTYSGRRISNRLRGDEVPPDLRRQAEAINRFDIELYSWASQRFDRIVEEEGIGFQLDVFGMRLAHRLPRYSLCHRSRPPR